MSRLTAIPTFSNRQSHQHDDDADAECGLKKELSRCSKLPGQWQGNGAAKTSEWLAGASEWTVTAQGHQTASSMGPSSLATICSTRLSSWKALPSSKFEVGQRNSFVPVDGVVRRVDDRGGVWIDQHEAAKIVNGMLEEIRELRAARDGATG